MNQTSLSFVKEFTKNGGRHPTIELVPKVILLYIDIIFNLKSEYYQKFGILFIFTYCIWKMFIQKIIIKVFIV